MRKFFTHADQIVPMYHPRVTVETAVAQGAERSALLAGVGITEETLSSPDARISYNQWAVLVSNALRLTGNPALGFDVGKNIQIPQMGVLGLALMSSATGRDALWAALQHYRTIAPLFDLRLLLESGRGVLQVREAIPLLRHKEFAIEAILSAFDTQGRFLLGTELPIQSVSLSYPAPPYLDRYRELYDVPMLFDQDFVEVEFDPAILDVPISFGDPVTRKFAEQLCAEQSASVSVDGLVGRVQSLLAAARGRPPTLEELARVLQTSPRTLRRSFHEMRTSYQELLDEWRRARAEDLMRSTQMTLEQLAEQLGFSNVRSFRRAFKRWTGRNPSDFRQRDA